MTALKEFKNFLTRTEKLFQTMKIIYGSHLKIKLRPHHFSRPENGRMELAGAIRGLDVILGETQKSAEFSKKKHL